MGVRYLRTHFISFQSFPSFLGPSLATSHSSPYIRPGGAGVSRVNDGTEGGEGTETPRDRREHGERRDHEVETAGGRY